jgi:hypothetical protein
MSRPRTLLVSLLVALASLAIAAPSAPAQPPPEASCVGVLSSFAEPGVRAEFAPAPGAMVARVAREHGDFGYCFSVAFPP